jgi:glycogen debranching enzyme
MVDPQRAISHENPSPEAPCEWLVANGLGGYASATITGEITRRYHGFLIAAQPAPIGRMVVLNDLEVDVELEDSSVVNLRENGRFVDFTLNMGLPSWRYSSKTASSSRSRLSCRRAKTSCIVLFARSALASASACG